MELALISPIKQLTKHDAWSSIRIDSHKLPNNLPKSRAYIVVARFVILAFFIVSFPWLRSTKSSSGTKYDDQFDANSNDSKMMSPFVFNDLVKDGLLKDGDKAVFLSNDEAAVRKVGQEGIYEIQARSNARKLLGLASEEKKAALRKLEDVLLEPPRASSRKSRTYLKNTRYLPDLMKDSLESYPRRVFIDIGLPEKAGANNGGSSCTAWFVKYYPRKNTKFDMYKFEIITEESSSSSIGNNAKAVSVGMADWLKKNVKEEEFVVMKAEAEVVEEMMSKRAINLVDELFLECKPRRKGDDRLRRKRAYWECLALYGRLRDEGVAVHQWWG